VVNPGCGIYVEVVGPELVDVVLLEVGSSLADLTVPATAFPTGEFVSVAVHADEENVEAGQEVGKLEPPAAVLDDVVDHELFPAEARAGMQRWKPVEEDRSEVLGPGERSRHVAATGEGAAVYELVAAQVEERLVEDVLELTGESRLPRA